MRIAPIRRVKYYRSYKVLNTSICKLVLLLFKDEFTDTKTSMLRQISFICFSFAETLSTKNGNFCQVNYQGKFSFLSEIGDKPEIS